MDWVIFLKGLVLGFSIAAPVGPMGVLCIKRTMAGGTIAGLCTGLGTATADAAYGCIAAFGLTAVSVFILGMGFYLKVFGGLFLLYLGVATFFAAPAAMSGGGRSKNLFANCVSAFFLTLANPMTIMSFAAIFAGFGVGGKAMAGLLEPAFLVAGVFSGSMLWWLVLSLFTSIFREKLGQGSLRWINRLSGVVIIFFSLGSLAGAIF